MQKHVQRKIYYFGTLRRKVLLVSRSNRVGKGTPTKRNNLHVRSQTARLGTNATFLCVVLLIAIRITGQVPLADVSGTGSISLGHGNLVDNNRTTTLTVSTIGSLAPVVDFGSANAKTIRGYSVSVASTTFSSLLPTGWTIQGSNNGSTYVTIDTKSGISWQYEGQRKLFKITSPAAYRYYRLVNGSAATQFAELELFENYSISGSVFYDKNVNGVKEGDEPGINATNVWLKLLSSSTSTYSGTTDLNGDFSIDLAAVGTGNFLEDFSVVVFAKDNLQPRSERMPQAAYTYPQLYPDGSYIMSSRFMSLLDKNGQLNFGFGYPSVTNYSDVGRPNLIQNANGGTFGESSASAADYLAKHPNSRYFSLTASHTELYAPITDLVTGSSYTYQGGAWNYNNGSGAGTGILWHPGTYVVTDLLGSVNIEAGGSDGTERKGLLNDLNSGWRVTTGATTGSWNDRYLAVNGANTSVNTIIFADTVNLQAGNQYSMGFYGKTANKFYQGADYSRPSVVDYLVRPYGNETSLASGTLTVTPSTGNASDSVNLGWKKAVTDFGVLTSGQYIVQYRLNAATNVRGNDAFLDNFFLRQSSYGISGRIYNDANGLTDSQVNGTGLSSIGSKTFYVYLLDPIDSRVIGKTEVQPDGSYKLFAPEYAAYHIAVDTASFSNGEIYEQTASYLPWQPTGADEGVNNVYGSEASVARIIDVYPANASADITGVDFGFQRPPTAVAQNYNIATPASGSSITLNGTGSSSSPGPLKGSDPEDQPVSGSLSGKIVRIKSLPENGVLMYNGSAVPVPSGGYYEIADYDPSKLTVLFSGTGYTSVAFSYAYVDEAGVASDDVQYTIQWAAPLPVNLVDFTLSPADNGVFLKWGTSGEKNSAFFDVQHRLGANMWNSIGRVNALNESNSLQHYSFYHSKPANGINYYRLKMADLDGSYEFSSIRAIEMAGKNCSIYPNPVSELLIVKAVNLLRLKLYSVTGAEVYDSGSNVTSGINVRDFPNGIYLIQLFYSDGSSESQRIVVAK